jgi:hypothetical protein
MIKAILLALRTCKRALILLHNVQVMRAISLLALLALAGCGNAYESVSIGDWQEVGSAQIPTTDINPLSGEVVLKSLAAGRGAKIKPGDLVQIRISAKEYLQGWPGRSETQVIWLWVGREPPWTSYNDYENWGRPGSARLRRALVGRTVGDVLEARLAPGAEGLIVLPLRGLSASGQDRKTGHDAWPEFSFDAKTPVQIEIGKACAAKMYRKTVTIRQFGFDVPVFGHHSPKRQGELHWSAVEARCPDEQLVRLEVGPLYQPARDDWTRLMYYPHEYPNFREVDDYREILGVRLQTWLLAVALLVVVAALIWRYRRHGKAASHSDHGA